MDEHLWRDLGFFRRLPVVERDAFNPEISVVENGRENNIPTNREQLIAKIEELVLVIIRQLARGEAPSISFISRAKWTDVSYQREIGLLRKNDATFHEVKFSNQTSVKKFSIIVSLLKKIFHLLRWDMYCTKRELFYQDVQFYSSQETVDAIVDDLSCFFRVSRRELHILAELKGLIAGNLTYRDGETFVSCANTDSGILMPNNVQGLKQIESNAEIILVIEKHAVFQKLLDDHLFQFIPSCIMITGKGFPDITTREFVHMLSNLLNISVLAIVDADPWGIEILCTYKYGSLSLAHDAVNLTCPAMKWLGVHATDVERLNLPQECQLLMTDPDISKIQNLQRRPYFENNEPSWIHQLEVTLNRQRKIEIESLYHIADNFLARVYIPTKLRLKGWI